MDVKYEEYSNVRSHLDIEKRNEVQKQLKNSYVFLDHDKGLFVKATNFASLEIAKIWP